MWNEECCCCQDTGDTDQTPDTLVDVINDGIGDLLGIDLDSLDE